MNIVRRSGISRLLQEDVKHCTVEDAKWCGKISELTPEKLRSVLIRALLGASHYTVEDVKGFWASRVYSAVGPLIMDNKCSLPERSMEIVANREVLSMDDVEKLRMVCKTFFNMFNSELLLTALCMRNGLEYRWSEPGMKCTVFLHNDEHIRRLIASIEKRPKYFKPIEFVVYCISDVDVDVVKAITALLVMKEKPEGDLKVDGQVVCSEDTIKNLQKLYICLGELFSNRDLFSGGALPWLVIEGTKGDEVVAANYIGFQKIPEEYRDYFHNGQLRSNA